MNVSAFYKSARNYAEKIKREKPGMVSEPDSCLCLIVNDNREVMTGITTVKVTKGKIETVHAEQNAIAAMTDDHRTHAKHMIVLSFEDYSVCTPCEDCLNLLYKANAENRECKVVVDENSIETVEQLLKENEEMSDDLTADLDDAPVEREPVVSKSAAPMEFVAGFEFDADNPFAAPSTPAAGTAEPAKPKFLYQTPETEEPEEEEADSAEEEAAEEPVAVETAPAAETVAEEAPSEEEPSEPDEEVSEAAPVEDKHEPAPAVQESEAVEEEEEEKQPVYESLFKDESRLPPEPKGDVGNKNTAERGLSKKELLKLAKQRKKNAKANAKMNR